MQSRSTHSTLYIFFDFCHRSYNKFFQNINTSSYCDGVQRALKGEQNAVRKYRRILYALQDRVQINILTGIITDEIRHGILYNYLYSKNSCRV